jgi:formylglycine-generating enzyme required for sulfatase activity
MADVFISYKREERPQVERLAQELRALGLSVWFDASLNAGEAFSDEIDREAHDAKTILVCWSPTARDSKWVKSESLIGFEQGKLAACYVAGPDGFYPPTPFNSIHAEDMRAWLAAPSAAHAGWKSLLRRIGRLCGREDVESYGALDVQAPAAALRAWLNQHDASPLFMTVDALLRARDAEDAERARLEREARERRAQEEAERARQEAERQAAATEARREAQAREAERQAQEKALAEEQKQRAAAAFRKWLVLAGAAGLALVGLLAWSPWNRSNLPASDAPPMVAEAPAGSPEAPAAEPTAPPPTPVETVAEIGADARTTPASTRAPVVRNPASLPDFALFRDCDGCPEMVVIPAGSFVMGSPAGESGRYTNEGPQRTVNISRFAAGKFEVTFDEWAACVAGGGCLSNANPGDEGWGRGRRPVINVSRDDAQDYVQWLSQKTGQRYSLLTEAQWEYAARAGTTTAYSTGPSITASQARFNSNSTMTVGSFAANQFGLHDMHGNVWEWTQDRYVDTYSGAPTNGSAVTTGDSWSGVMRGGSWNNNPQNLRSANRGINPSIRHYNGGFRLARVL